MVEAYKQFTFEAAHALPPHSGLHGHTFRIDVVFSGEPDPEFGWCENLDAADERVREVWKVLDHSCLNEIEGLEKPSLENLARWIWDRLAVSFPDTLDRVQVARGPDGMSEGCTYSARPRLHAA
jgi:6-pyruvoyltetrahydropterin/6-carboxytetrahydropterin synthase